MDKFKKVILVISIFFSLLTLVLFIIRLNGYILRLQGNSNYSLILLAFFLLVVFSFVYSILVFPMILKIVLGFVLGTYGLIIGSILIFTNFNGIVITKGDYEIIVEIEELPDAEELWFYETKNFFFSKQIGTCTDNDSVTCSYRIEEDLFIIEECGRRPCKVQEIELD